jgi:uncharacterized protein (DUF3084 family)
MENKDKEKELKLAQVKKLEKDHEDKREELLKILQAIELLEKQYKEITGELYKIEEDYVQLMKEIVQ